MVEDLIKRLDAAIDDFDFNPESNGTLCGADAAGEFIHSDEFRAALSQEQPNADTGSGGQPAEKTDSQESPAVEHCPPSAPTIYSAIWLANEARTSISVADIECVSLHDYSILRSRYEAIEAAARELVECKRLKERIESFHRSAPYEDEYCALIDEYERRKEPAWAAMKSALEGK